MTALHVRILLEVCSSAAKCARQSSRYSYDLSVFLLSRHSNLSHSLLYCAVAAIVSFI